MIPIRLTYGNESFKEIAGFLMENYHKDYSLSIYNSLEQSTIEVICDFNSFVDVIVYVSNIEHDFPALIGVNEISDSYVVGMAFTKGHLHTPSVCEWKDGRLIERQV